MAVIAQNLCKLAASPLGRLLSLECAELGDRGEASQRIAQPDGHDDFHNHVGARRAARRH